MDFWNLIGRIARNRSELIENEELGCVIPRSLCDKEGRCSLIDDIQPL